MSDERHSNRAGQRSQLLAARVFFPALLATGLALAIASCGGDGIGEAARGGAGDESPDFGEPDPGTGGGADAGSGPTCCDAGSGSDDVSLPPETEERVTFGAPTASRRFVYVTNRDAGVVARIDSETLAVTPIRVGNDPLIVRAMEDRDRAVVLSGASSTVSIIDAEPAEPTVTQVEIGPGSNAIELSPDGRFAAVWFANARAQSGDPIGSLQEVFIVDLLEAESYAVSVGFNVRRVAFTDDGEQAFAITDREINRIRLLELDGDTAVPGIPIGDSTLSDLGDREVAVSSSGSFALARASVLDGVRLIDLATGDSSFVDLGAPATDLDLTHDESRAVVALRSRGEIALLPLPETLSDHDAVVVRSIEAGPTGLVELTSDDRTALTYTTLGTDRRVAVISLDSASGGVRGLALQKGVRALAGLSNPELALALHPPDEEVEDDASALEREVARSPGYSLLHLPSSYAKLTLLPTEPDAFVETSDGRWLFLMLSEPRRVEWIDLSTLSSRSIELSATPESIGEVPGTGRIYVSQDAEGGRISFISPSDGTVQHLSAYELNAFIE